MELSRKPHESKRGRGGGGGEGGRGKGGGGRKINVKLWTGGHLLQLWSVVFFITSFVTFHVNLKN